MTRFVLNLPEGGGSTHIVGATVGPLRFPNAGSFILSRPYATWLMQASQRGINQQFDWVWII